VRFRCADEHRRRSRRPEQPTDRLPEAAAPEPVDRWLSPELAAAMDSLSQRQSLMLELRHVDGLSGQDIADLLDMKRPATYAALDRAEASLRKAFTEAVESSARAASLPVRKDDPHVTS
jgi:DNA-directed RNA polymerase specialized sigma24 family protein